MTHAKPGRYSFEGLDRLFHERARLAILTSLASRPDGLLFNELKEHCALTDGNLSQHLRCLREAGVIEMRRQAAQGRPSTLCRLSPKGRARFLGYLDALEEAVRDAAAASRKAPRLDSGTGLAPA